jgi:hypothetical protein
MPFHFRREGHGARHSLTNPFRVSFANGFGWYRGVKASFHSRAGARLLTGSRLTIVTDRELKDIDSDLAKGIYRQRLNALGSQDPLLNITEKSLPVQKVSIMEQEVEIATHEPEIEIRFSADVYGYRRDGSTWEARVRGQLQYAGFCLDVGQFILEVDAHTEFLPVR